MKALPGLTKFGLIIIIAFCCSAGTCDRKHNVVFLPDYDTADQIILPGTEISEEDAAALLKTLNASDRSFFIIQSWKKGRPDGPPIGKLPFPECLKPHNFPPFDNETGHKTGISRTNSSRWSRVIGMGCQTRCVSNTEARVRRAKSKRASQDLVNAVKETLQKYQKEK